MEENNKHMRESYIDVNDLLNYFEIILRKRKHILWIIIIINLPIIIYLLNAASIYTVTTTLLPSESTPQSPLRAIARNIGSISDLNFSSSGISDLYEPIIKSDRIMKYVLSRKYHFLNKRQSLYDIYEIESESDLEELELGIGLLRNLLEVDIDKGTGITTIKISSIDPKLSADIAVLFIEALDQYLRQVNIEKARHNKSFIESRLEETLVTLEISEDNLKIFRKSNMRIENSPELLLEQGRLVREVRVQEELYLTLKKEFEIVRIEEVKSLPLVRILDNPRPPLEKSKPRRRLIMFSSIIGSVILGLFFVWISEIAKAIYANNYYANRIDKIKQVVIDDLRIIKKIRK